jgi:ketosteroid isomerase-like protein
MLKPGHAAPRLGDAWPVVSEGDEMSESNLESARRGYEAMLRGDYDAIAELLDPDVKWHAGDPSATYACHNKREALEFMRRASRRPPPELLDVIDAGDSVVVIVRPAAEGDEPAAPSANVTTFRDGKVVEMVHYPDPHDALAAAGVSGASSL